MNDYMNPFALVPNSSEFASDNFLGVMNAASKMQMAMPFIQMAQEQQGLNLGKERIKAHEFAGPEATASRISGFEKEAAENRAARDLAPVRSLADLEEQRQRLRSLPYLTEQKIAEAEDAAMKARGRPAAQLINDLGGLHEYLETIPEEMRPGAYNDAIQRWQSANPGAKLPPALQQYNPQNLASMAWARLHTQTHDQDLNARRTQGDIQQTLDERNNVTRLNIAAMQTEAARDAASLRWSMTGSRENINQAIARLRRTIAANPNDRQAQEELSFHMNSEFMKIAKEDTMLQIYAARAGAGDNEALKAFDKRFESERRKFYMQNGIRADGRGFIADQVVVTKNGRQFRLPKSQLDAALKQGYTLVPQGQESIQGGGPTQLPQPGQTPPGLPAPVMGGGQLPQE